MPRRIRKVKIMIKLLLFGSLGTGEIILLVLLFLLLFGGATKIPELMKGMGKGIRMFRESMDGVDEESRREGKSAPRNVEKPEKDEEPKKE